MASQRAPFFILSLFACLQIMAYHALAQVRMESLTVVEGLSQGFVTSLIQDARGYIWIGTYDGLNRFDGYSVRRFSTKPFNARSLQSTFITKLYEDKHQLIWVGTHQGLCVFDPLTESFFTFNLPDNQLPESHVGQITGDSQGSIFVHIPTEFSPTGVFRIRVPDNFPDRLRQIAHPLKGIRAEPIGASPGLLPPCTLLECIGDTMPLLVDENAQTFRFSYTDHVFRPFDLHRLPASLTDQHNMLWGKYKGYLFRWKRPNGRDSIPPFVRWQHLFPLKDGGTAIWFSEHGPLYQKNDHAPLRFDIGLSGQAFQALPVFQETFSMLLPENPKWNSCVLMDDSGVLWASTNGWGIRKTNPRQLSFGSLFAGRSISSLRELPDGRIWVRMFDDTSFVVNPVTGAAGVTPWGNLKWLYEVFADSKGDYWLIEPSLPNQNKRRLRRFEKKTGKTTYFPITLPFINGVPEKVFEDRDGNIWIAAHHGLLYRYRAGQSNMEPFSYAQIATQHPDILRATAIAQTPDGVIWVGTNRGLLRADATSSVSPQFMMLKHDPNKLNSISSDWITSICVDPSDAHFLWLGTRGGGLIHLNTLNNSSNYLIDTPNGLPDNVVYAVLSDDHGNLWCSTNRGLCCYNPAQNTFVTYLESDGLLSTEFNTNAYMRSRDGRLWFGGVSGLNVFRPEDLHLRKVSPRVVISGIKVQGNTRLPDVEGQLTLSYQENNVVFEFAALDFTNPATNRFRHRLKGIDKTWIEDGTAHTANYAALPPGNYVLELQAATADSPWSEPGLFFSLTIRPPWYRHWLAYLIYGLMTWALITGLVRYREKLYKLELAAATNLQESGRLKAFEAVKNQFFSNVAHEFRTPLTVILGLANRLKHADNEAVLEDSARIIAAQGNTLLELTNQILDLAKLESQHFSLHLSNGNICQCVQQATAALSPLAQSKGLQLVATQKAPDVWMDFDPVQIQKILNNLVSNAIRHSSPGKSIQIETSLEKDGTWLRLDVRDQGEGIASEDLPHVFDRFYQGSKSSNLTGTTGIGLTITRDLVRLMEGEILVESQLGLGSCFSIRLPIRNQMPRGAVIESTKPILAVSNPHTAPSGPKGLPLLLILEDNEAVGNFLRVCLQPYYQLAMATNGDAGVEKALELIPDLILTDLAMPGKDGFEVTSILKNDVRTSHIPIVMLTAKVEPQHRLEGKRRGANAYLTKPFEEQELLLVLSNLLHLQTQWKQRYAQFLRTPQPTFETFEPKVELRIEDAFMQKLYVIFEDNYMDDAFNLERLCRLLGMSSSQLDRKLKVLRNQSPMQMLRSFRLQKAYTLLQVQPKLSIKDVCFKVGFKNPAHFSRAFSEEFGIPPSEV